MTTQSPAVQMEARANREAAKLLSAEKELHVVATAVQRSELPMEIKLRLYAALSTERELLVTEGQRIEGLRQAAQLSRTRQWVTSGDE